MKVIIIGSKGFIGRNILHYYVNKGHEVYGADITPNDYNHKNYFLIDSSDPDFEYVFKYIKFDICINCSGAASVPESFIDPIKDFLLNTVNVIRILGAIKKYQSNCKFLNLSSAAVYGNPSQIPVKEGSILSPLSPYGIHKLQAEQICKEYYNFFDVRTCSVRIFSVYGPGLRKQLFWDLFHKAKTGIPFKLFGTGDESRDFIYIYDLLIALDLVIYYSEFLGDVINVANGEEIKIKDATSIFLNNFKNRIQYEFSGEIREGDPVKWCADIGKLKSFGYKPFYNINTGLRKYFEWVNCELN